MIPDKPSTKPLYTIGDLIIVRGFALLLKTKDQTIGVITKGPYSYRSIDSYHDLVYFEWWCYDVLIGSELVRMIPENFLLEVNLNEDKD